MPNLRWFLVPAAFICIAVTTVNTSVSNHHSLNEGQVQNERRSTSELVHREKRQILQKTFGFFGALGSLGDLISQTKNETQFAYRQISRMLADSVGSDTPTSTSTASSASVSSDDTTDTSNTAVTSPASSTTAAPYRATRTELMTILRRNFKGLRNLFQKEWKQSMIDSGINFRDARREFREGLRTVTTSTTTTTTEAP